jgi:hypothetical protein
MHMQSEQEDFLAMGLKAQTPAGEGVTLTVESEAQGLARKIKESTGGERQYNLSIIASEIATIERNIENGYAGWEFRLAVLRRTLELAGGMY